MGLVSTQEVFGAAYCVGLALVSLLVVMGSHRKVIVSAASSADFVVHVSTLVNWYFYETFFTLINTNAYVYKRLTSPGFQKRGQILSALSNRRATFN